MSFGLKKLKLNFDQVKKDHSDCLEVDEFYVGKNFRNLVKCFDPHSKSSKILWHESEMEMEGYWQLSDLIPIPLIPSSDGALKVYSSSLNKLGLRFYKDGEFRNFQGRAKIGSLDKMFEVFKSNPICCYLSALIEKIDLKKISINGLKILKGELKSIDLTENGWILESVNGEIVKTKSLTWSDEPEKFLKIFQAKDKTNKEILSYVESVSSQTVLLASFEIEGFESKNEFQSVLVPYTMGQDDGYFLVGLEINPLEQSPEKTKAIFKIMSVFKSKEEVSEELVISTLKQIKRQLCRVFELKKDKLVESKIILTSNSIFITDQKKYFEGAKFTFSSDCTLNFVHDCFYEMENRSLEFWNMASPFLNEDFIDRIAPLSHHNDSSVHF